MKKQFIAWFLIISTIACCEILAQVPDVSMLEFDYVDSEGFIDLQIDIDEIRVDDFMSVPIQLRFSTRPVPADENFKNGWQFPILNGFFYPTDQNFIKVCIPWDDYVVELKKIKGLKNMYENDHWGWRAKMPKDGSLILTRSSGERFIFENGMIVRYVSEAGKELIWKRDDNETRLFLGGTLKMELKRENTQLTIKLPGRKGGKEYVVEQRKGSAGMLLYKDGIQVESFQWVKDKYYKYQKLDQSAVCFKWNEISGYAEVVGPESNMWKYEINNIYDDDNTLNYSNISRSNNRGEYELNEFNYRNGIQTTISNKIEKIVHYFLMEGPYYMKVRKIEIMKDGKSLKYQAIYDERGILRKDIDAEGKVSIYRYDENNRLVKKSTDGKVYFSRVWKRDHWQDVYRIGENEFVKVIYKNKSDSVLVQVIENGKVVESQTLAYDKVASMFKHMN